MALQASLTNYSSALGTDGKPGQAAPKLGSGGEVGSVLPHRSPHRAVKRG